MKEFTTREQRTASTVTSDYMQGNAVIMLCFYLV